MFEVVSQHFERGVLELRCEKRYPGPLNLLLGLGPIRGRLIALSCIAGAALLEIRRRPPGVTNFAPAESGAVAPIIWALFAVGIVIYALAFLFRREALSVAFDRAVSEVQFLHQGLSAKSRGREGRVPFAEIQDVHVHKNTVEVRTRSPLRIRGGSFRFTLPSLEERAQLAKSLAELMDKPLVEATTELR